MISIEKLLKKYGSTIAVDIENLNITKGEIFGLVGNNGAGKTTLLRLMLDLLKPDRGNIRSKSEIIYQSEHWKKYTGSFIDDNFLIGFLKPEEYFDFIGFLYGMNAPTLKKRIEGFETFMNGEVFGLNKYIRNLSSGNKQKVGIMGAMISEPEVLILDEPFNFLDPSSQISLKEILKRYHEENTKIIILSSHNLSHISDLCTRVALMEKGKIIKDCKNNSDTMKEIEAYFNSQVGIF
ncbi:MAG: ABC transporter ATP-binding protein [Bacteroidales bacterium]